MGKTLQQIFGEKLRDIRKEKGMSQEALAYDSHIERAYISMLERGLRAPSITTLFALSETLGIRPSKFIEMIEEDYSYS